MNDQAFDRIFEEFFTDWLTFNPSSASWLGFHQHDGQVEDLRHGTVESELKRLKGFQIRLQKLDPATLSSAVRFDYHQLFWQIGSEVFDLEEMRDWERNPMTYAQLLGISTYIKRNYAPLPQRVRAIIQKFSKYSQIIATAQENVKDPSRHFVEAAVEIAEGQTKFFKSDLPKALKDLKDAMLSAEFAEAQAQAVKHIREFISWLKTDILPKARGDYALGEAKFKKMLRLKEMIDFPLSDLEAMGERELARLEGEYKELAKKINPKRSLEEIHQELETEHPTEQSLFSDTAKLLKELQAFLEEKKIVTLPSNEVCQVTETPAYYRHMALAAMDPPGMFEQHATEAYYYVTPTEPEWDAKHKEEWLKFFNYPVLRMISIHEAYPGHYVHFLHYRNAPSRVRKAFGSYSFVEGWAHYSEQMMLEEGYGSGDLKLRLAQVNEALVRVCRYLVSIRMHTQGWTVEQATRFFMKHAHMVQSTAQKEAVRGTFDPGYLNYTLGKLLMLDLKKTYKENMGNRFNLKDFHDRLLSFGAPPIKLAREEMLKI